MKDDQGTSPNKYTYPGSENLTSQHNDQDLGEGDDGPVVVVKSPDETKNMLEKQTGRREPRISLNGQLSDNDSRGQPFMLSHHYPEYRHTGKMMKLLEDYNDGGKKYMPWLNFDPEWNQNSKKPPGVDEEMYAREFWEESPGQIERESLIMDVDPQTWCYDWAAIFVSLFNEEKILVELEKYYLLGMYGPNRILRMFALEYKDSLREIRNRLKDNLDIVNSKGERKDCPTIMRNIMELAIRLYGLWYRYRELEECCRTYPLLQGDDDMAGEPDEFLEEIRYFIQKEVHINLTPYLFLRGDEEACNSMEENEDECIYQETMRKMSRIKGMLVKDPGNPKMGSLTFWKYAVDKRLTPDYINNALPTVEHRTKMEDNSGSPNLAQPQKTGNKGVELFRKAMEKAKLLGRPINISDMEETQDGKSESDDLTDCRESKTIGERIKNNPPKAWPKRRPKDEIPRTMSVNPVDAEHFKMLDEKISALDLKLRTESKEAKKEKRQDTPSLTGGFRLLDSIENFSGVSPTGAQMLINKFERLIPTDYSDETRYKLLCTKLKDLVENALESAITDDVNIFKKVNEKGVMVDSYDKLKQWLLETFAKNDDSACENAMELAARLKQKKDEALADYILRASKIFRGTAHSIPPSLQTTYAIRGLIPLYRMIAKMHKPKSLVELKSILEGHENEDHNDLGVNAIQYAVETNKSPEQTEKLVTLLDKMALENDKADERTEQIVNTIKQSQKKEEDLKKNSEKFEKSVQNQFEQIYSILEQRPMNQTEMQQGSQTQPRNAPASRGFVQPYRPYMKTFNTNRFRNFSDPNQANNNYAGRFGRQGGQAYQINNRDNRPYDNMRFGDNRSFQNQNRGQFRQNYQYPRTQNFPQNNRNSFRNGQYQNRQGYVDQRRFNQNRYPNRNNFKDDFRNRNNYGNQNKQDEREDRMQESQGNEPIQRRLQEMANGTQNGNFLGQTAPRQ